MGMPLYHALEGCKDAGKMVLSRATEDGELTCPAAARRGTGPQGAEQQEGHGHSRRRRRLHGAAVRPPRPRCSAPHAQAAAAGSRAPRPGLAWATRSQPRPELWRPRRCSLRRGAASVLHCAPRALPLVGGASECCIGRLAVAKWFLAPPTSSPGRGSGGRRALGGERAPAAFAPRTGAGARARESAGKCSSLSASCCLHDGADCRDLVTTESSTAWRWEGGKGQEKERSSLARPPGTEDALDAPLREPGFGHCVPQELQ